MSRELTERQSEILKDIALIAEQRAALQAEDGRLKELLESATRAAVVEGVKQRLIAQMTGLTPGRISQLASQVVRPWLLPDRNGIAPRDEWRTWLEQHQRPTPPK